MTREEYRNHVHAIADLVMDIQELNTEVDDDVTVSMQTDRVDDRVRVWVQRINERTMVYDFGQKSQPWYTKPEEIIKMLQEIKAELETCHERNVASI